MHLKFNQNFSNLIRQRIDSTNCCHEILWLQTAQIVQHQGLFLFERFKPKGEIDPRISDDETGLECFLNKFHFAADSVELCIATAIYIFIQIDLIWENTFGTAIGTIRQIVSIDRCANEENKIDGAYRFHFVRDNQSWLNENLDYYELDIVLVSG